MAGVRAWAFDRLSVDQWFEAHAWQFDAKRELCLLPCFQGTLTLYAYGPMPWLLNKVVPWFVAQRVRPGPHRLSPSVAVESPQLAGSRCFNQSFHLAVKCVKIGDVSTVFGVSPILQGEGGDVLRRWTVARSRWDTRARLVSPAQLAVYVLEMAAEVREHAVADSAMSTVWKHNGCRALLILLTGFASIDEVVNSKYAAESFSQIKLQGGEDSSWRAPYNTLTRMLLLARCGRASAVPAPTYTHDETPSEVLVMLAQHGNGELAHLVLKFAQGNRLTLIEFFVMNM